jgi:hypothetical protein
MPHPWCAMFYLIFVFVVCQGPNCFIFADEDSYKMTVKACSDNMKVMMKKKKVEVRKQWG